MNSFIFLSIISITTVLSGIITFYHTRQKVIREMELVDKQISESNIKSIKRLEQLTDNLLEKSGIKSEQVEIQSPRKRMKEVGIVQYLNE